MVKYCSIPLHLNAHHPRSSGSPAWSHKESTKCWAEVRTLVRARQWGTCLYCGFPPDLPDTMANGNCFSPPFFHSCYYSQWIPIHRSRYPAINFFSQSFYSVTLYALMWTLHAPVIATHRSLLAMCCQPEWSLWVLFLKRACLAHAWQSNSTVQRETSVRCWQELGSKREAGQPFLSTVSLSSLVHSISEKSFIRFSEPHFCARHVPSTEDTNTNKLQPLEFRLVAIIAGQMHSQVHTHANIQFSDLKICI